MTNRQWFVLHSWAGFTFGALLLLVCITGVLATISYEIQYMLDSKYQALSARTGPVAWQKLEQNLALHYPDSQIISAQVQQQAYLAGEVELAMPSGFKFVYFDPASGQLTGSGDWARISRFMRNLHMYLSMGSIGKLVVTSLSWLLVVILISSFYVYRNWWRQWLRKPQKWQTKLRISWTSWHKFIAIWSWWFIVLISLTSLWYFSEFWLFKADVEYYPKSPHVTQTASLESAQPVSLAQIFMAAQAIRPDLDIRQIRYNTAPNAAITVSGQTANFLLRNRANKVYLNKAADVIGQQNHKELGVLAYLTDLADPVHFGNFAGIGVKLIYVIFGSGLCFLVASGMRMHWLRTKRKQPSLAVWLGVFGWLSVAITVAAIAWTAATFSQRDIKRLPLSPQLGQVLKLNYDSGVTK